MTSVIGTLHQSGEAVVSPGIYRLVELTQGGKSGTLITLQRGQLFPDQNGREVCWYLVRAIAAPKATAPLYTDWQENKP